MKVMKFGGTSVGSANALLNVKKIVESQNEEVIVVVSALSGITDALYNISTLAAKGNETYKNELETIQFRHFDIIDQTVSFSERDQVKQKITLLFEELSNM